MNVISIIFHPLLMATYLCAILLIYAPSLIPNINANKIIYLLTIIFITTFLIPALSIFSLKAFAVIENLSLDRRSERFYPFLLICVFYGITGYIFIDKLKVPPPLSTMVVSTAILIFMLTIINKWIKISIHATAVWATTGYISALYALKGLDILNAFYLFILVSSITCTSRLFLDKHTPKEIWLGSILGFGFSHLIIYFFG